MPKGQDGKQKFEKKVKWHFKVACSGYGRTVKEALLDAAENLEREIEMDFHDADFEAIEEHEVSLIEQDDVLEEDDEQG